jgi:Zn-dependent protease with chaperone function
MKRVTGRKTHPANVSRSGRLFLLSDLYFSQSCSERFSYAFFSDQVKYILRQDRHDFIGGLFLSLLPFGQLYSRRFENESDRFAYQLTGGIKSPVSSLIKRSKDNL